MSNKDDEWRKRVLAEKDEYISKIRCQRDELANRLDENGNCLQCKEKNKEIMSLKADSCYIENARLKTELRDWIKCAQEYSDEIRSNDEEWRKKIEKEIERWKDHEFATMLYKSLLE
jgi:hypothetical protein